MLYFELYKNYKAISNFTMRNKNNNRFTMKQSHYYLKVVFIKVILKKYNFQNILKLIEYCLKFIILLVFWEVVNFQSDTK